MQEINMRIYLDSDGNVQAERIDNSPDSAVFTVIFPVPNVVSYTCYFVDMEVSKAQKIALENEELMIAITNEATRLGLGQDVRERYFMLQFKLHPSQNKYKNKLANRLGDALEKNEGWLNPVILTVGTNEYRFDMVVTNEDKTRQAIARILKQYAVKKFEFVLNDF